MTRVFRYLVGLLLFTATHSIAEVPIAAKEADVVVLGEVHDNPAHHEIQVNWLREIAPKAVVYEMLLPGEAERLRGGAVLAEDLDGFHWSNIGDYIPLFDAVGVPVIGAARPRDQVRAAFSETAAAVFGGDAARYGLNDPVPADQLEMRKKMQFEAHCEAMPLEMMGGMVEAQRLRDAAFAKTTLEALGTYGAPIVLITGNGHARKDWGVPAYMRAAAPHVTVFALGQSVNGRNPAGDFDLVLDAPASERDDPCAAFK